MDKIIEYLRANPNYVIALIVTFSVLLVACILGFLIKKFNLLRFMDNWFKKPTPEPEQAKEDPAEPALNDAVPETEDDLPAEEESAPTEQPEYPVEPAAQEDVPEEPKRNSRFSEMIKQSLENNAADEYEQEKRLTPKTVAPVVKSAPAPVAEPAPIEEEAPAHEGKWRILPVGSTYVAHLYNDADTLLLKSQNYSAIGEAKKAIEMLKKNIEGNNFSIAVDKKGQFYFKLFSPSGRLICCGEPCSSGSDCKQIIEDVKRIAFTAETVRG